MENKPTEDKGSAAKKVTVTKPVVKTAAKPVTKPVVDKKVKAAKEEKKGGNRMIFIVLIALLGLGNAAFGWLWFQERGRANTEVIIKEEVIVERDNVKEDLLDIQDAYATLQTNDKAMQLELDTKRVQIDSLLELAEEHQNDKAMISRLRREARSLRKIMKHYIVEIDSLNTLNKTIVAERDKMFAALSSEKSRSTQLDKDKNELLSTVAKAGSLQATSPKATGVKFKSGGNKESATSKAARVERIKVSFVLAENHIAKKGERAIYIRIVSPDGKEITKSPDEANMFEYGKSKGYFAKRKFVKYKNKSMAVDIYCGSPTGFIPGKYMIDIASEGMIIGQAKITLK